MKGRPARLKRAACVLLMLAAATVVYALAGHVMLGAQAYLFGHPLLIMDITRANAALIIGPENQLRRTRQFPDADFRDVVRPNVATLYTSAFIDMAKGPWVFEMAANGRRYEVMPFMDAWSNVFAAPGTRTTGTGGGKFLLADAAWQGRMPPGLTLLRAPTRIVLLDGSWACLPLNVSTERPAAARLTI